MAFGEDSTTGTWGNAGTNGGSHLFVVSQSYGLRPFYPWLEVSSLAAGMHFYATLMPTSGDSNDNATVGQAFASFYNGNPASSVSSAWMNALASVNEGGTCASGLPSHGFTTVGSQPGCGCYVIMSFNTSGTTVTNTFNENWAALQTERNTPLGSGYLAWGVGCDYNVQTYGWTGGD